MIDVEVAITPVGTGNTSISDFVAESERALKNHPDLNYKITGMATEIEGRDINDIFNAIKEMHSAQINKGAQRVSTYIRIDDRRDKNNTLDDKVSSVRSKL